MDKPHSLAIIDDDSTFHRIMKFILARVDPELEVVSFLSGLEALTYFQEQAARAEALPHLVLLDINMPFMDGWQFLEAFQELPSLARQPTIYLCSSSTDKLDLVQASHHPLLAGYLFKPVPPQKIKEILV